MNADAYSITETASQFAKRTTQRKPADSMVRLPEHLAATVPLQHFTAEMRRAVRDYPFFRR
jgi:hypothetical protein